MKTITTLITDHIDIWTAAETEKKSGRGRASGNAGSVYGIKKLRELILELAVRGKLVPQDAGDEPASELLKRIQAEKSSRLRHPPFTKGGKTAAAALTTPPLAKGGQGGITEDEKPFELPKGWEWARFGDVLISRDADRIPVSAEERQFRKGEYDYYGASGVIDKIDKFLFDKPLLLIGEDGANLINRSTPIAFIARGKYWVNNHAHVLDGTSEDFLKYIELYINAIDLVPYVTGTAQPKMNQAKMNNIVLGLPSEAEQRRIVAKVDELMALCDQLESQHSNATEAHEKLVSHLLGTLLIPSQPPLLQRGGGEAGGDSEWQHIAAHFDTLFTTEASIDALKQTLLQLAVMGKLVPQDANDEPASELLKRIQAEKVKLIAEGKIKKDKPLLAITDDEKLFSTPIGWTWVRLGTIVEIKGGKRVSNGYKLLTQPTPHIYIRVSDMRNGTIDDSDLHYIDNDMFKKISRYIITKDDIYMTIVGATIGKCGLVPEKFDQMNLTENAARLIPTGCSEKLFLYKCLEGSICQNQFFDKTKQVGVQKMALNRLASTIVPLPPLAEQYRIVAKVDELMALCDQLKSRITDASRLQQKLADVLVEQAVA